MLIVTYDNLSQCKTTFDFQARSTKGQESTADLTYPLMDDPRTTPRSFPRE